ncbi:ubiquitin-conjugating enzyme E2C-binding protein [Sarocladium strictum]
MAAPEAADCIAIYAELLSNLRQLSVVASLPSHSDGTTSASLSSDGLRLTVSHQGQTQEIKLPERPIASALQVPEARSTEVSWRLRLPPLDQPPPRFTLEDQPLPWNARDIQRGSAVTCRACKASLINAGRIAEWKDLPSDNWAEMMEFWHCHKPVDHNNPSEGAEADGKTTNKGYGANNVISAQQGIGLIDVTSFVLSTDDCSAVLYSTSSPEEESNGPDTGTLDTGATRFLHAYCKSCAVEVGVFNVATEAVSLFKWSISCATIRPGPLPDITECLAATLMATISRSGSAKSIIAPHLIGRAGKTTGSRSLYIWVLNPNVVYAASKSARDHHGSAMKLLFRSVPVEEGNEIVDAMNSDVQELTLPEAAIEAVAQELEASNSLLPSREQLFQGWRVGLLHRWRLNDQ